jgi:beta-lactamase class C
MRTLALAVLVTAITCSSLASYAHTEDLVRKIVREEILNLLPADGAGGIAVAVRIEGRLLFFDEGTADRAAGRPVTPDTAFNIASLRKPFEATLLTLAVAEGTMALDEPVWKCVPELADGRDIRRVTLGQLATHMSGLLLPQDHPPWPTEHYSLASFLETLNAWQAEAEHQPGRQHMYTHAGYILLQLALERGLGAPIAELLQGRIFQPLGMHASLVPQRGSPPAHAVQGYGEDGAPIGVPGDQQTYYDFPGTGQMYSTATDLALFLAANMGESTGERPVPTALARALPLAQAPAVTIGPHDAQALAWEIDDAGGPAIVDKNGGLNNSSAYMGMIPAQKLGIVVLSNRGGIDVAQAGRRALRRVSQRRL